jgi:putative PIN family toxin of toxin-antitoxin system
MVNCKIIIDTNLWISLLIGKRMSELRSLCNDKVLSVHICEELKVEFLRISSREKIRKYVTEERVVQTLELMDTSCILTSVATFAQSPELRDKNDLYLLSLAETVQADYILTGDNDLLVLKQHYQTKIVSFNEFMIYLKNQTV